MKHVATICLERPNGANFPALLAASSLPGWGLFHWMLHSRLQAAGLWSALECHVELGIAARLRPGLPGSPPLAR